MAKLTLTAVEVVEIRRLVDTRATEIQLPTIAFTGDTTLGVATNWAWAEVRKDRVDGLGTSDDFGAFQTALSQTEREHFRGAVFFRTAGIVSNSYRELVAERAIDLSQDYASLRGRVSGEAKSAPRLLAEADEQIRLFRELAPVGAYRTGARYTLFSVV